MFVLKDLRCDCCGGLIEVIGCKEDDKKSSKTLHLVSNGICLNCTRGVTLPTEDYRRFTAVHCVNIEV